MPTTNPRVNVTLSPSTFALVEKLSKLQRVSKSNVLRELLEASEPMLGQAVAMMEAANEMGAQARKKVAQDLDVTIKEVERKARVAMHNAAGITADLVSQAEAIRSRRPRRAGADGPGEARTGRPRTKAPKPKGPPSSKRGVKP